MTKILVFTFFISFQKPDSDLIFEDGLGNTLSDGKITNERTKLVSKSDSIADNQNESDDEGWLSRVRRSFSGLFSREDDEIVQKREISSELNKSEQKIDFLANDYKLPSRRRRQIEDDDEDDDEDNEISSGDHETQTPEPAAVTPLPPVKDDKYCKFIDFFVHTKIYANFLFIVRLKMTVEEFWVDQLKDKNSNEFKTLAHSLKESIEKIYEEKNSENTKILARLVEVR